MSNNKIFHPADLENTDEWMLAHVALGVKKYTDLGEPRGFSKEIAPEWYKNLDDSDLEKYWDLQEKYLHDCLQWIDSIGVVKAYIRGVDEQREKDMLAEFNFSDDGDIEWKRELIDIVPSLNIQNLYVKATDGSELIIFESDTETLFVHDASNSLPGNLKNPVKL